MTVVRVGQLDHLDQMLEVFNFRVANMHVHQFPRALDRLGFQVGPLREQIPCPLVMNHIGPTRAVQVRQREMHQQVAQRSRI
ncbi:Uncharacterised protein [Burkholderia pseudomallei]|nr:Uncharacterised protein [Burkholderia pseudomallei]